MKDFELLIYNTPTEDVKVNVVLKDETIWATQKAMATLFGVTVASISRHISNIFESSELDPSTTVTKIETVVQRGFRGQISEEIDFYNLDMIISVGYRISSGRATQFRIWATSVLKEYIKKGFVLNDERMKNGGAIFGKDYFRELLERVRSIRASERRIWQQITDIYAECSIDYDKSAPTTKDFYAMVQNKFHYAIAGKTAAEIVYERADRTKENMGLFVVWNGPCPVISITLKISSSEKTRLQWSNLQQASMSFWRSADTKYSPIIVRDLSLMNRLKRRLNRSI